MQFLVKISWRFKCTLGLFWYSVIKKEKNKHIKNVFYKVPDLKLFKHHDPKVEFILI